MKEAPRRLLSFWFFFHDIDARSRVFEGRHGRCKGRTELGT